MPPLTPARGPHAVSVAFAASATTGLVEPLATNISDSLWVTSRAKFVGFEPRVKDPTVFTPPAECLHAPLAQGPRRH